MLYPNVFQCLPLPVHIAPLPGLLVKRYACCMLAGCKAAVELLAAPCGPVCRLRTDWQVAQVRAMHQSILLRRGLPAASLAAP